MRAASFSHPAKLARSHIIHFDVAAAEPEWLFSAGTCVSNTSMAGALPRFCEAQHALWPAFRIIKPLFPQHMRVFPIEQSQFRYKNQVRSSGEKCLPVHRTRLGKLVARGKGPRKTVHTENPKDQTFEKSILRLGNAALLSSALQALFSPAFILSSAFPAVHSWLWDNDYEHGPHGQAAWVWALTLTLICSMTLGCWVVSLCFISSSGKWTALRMKWDDTAEAFCTMSDT